MALLFALPLPTRHGNWLGKSWERVWITIGGAAALAWLEPLRQQCGALFRVPQTSGVAEALCALHARAPQLTGLGLTEAVVSLLCRLAATAAPGDRQHPPPVAAALALLRERLADSQLRVEDLAAAAGLARHHFSRVFQQAVGESPYQHLLQRRLQRGLALLRQGDVSVAAFAQACGFASRHRFHAACTKHFGRSPQKLREIS